eukprot:590324-Rhodomonas_salina.1
MRRTLQQFYRMYFGAGKREGHYGEIDAIVETQLASDPLFSVFLVVHHKYKHSDPYSPENYLPDTLDQWFQISDVCNFHSCSHEMWVIFCLFAAIVLFIVVATNCSDGAN